MDTALPAEDLLLAVADGDQAAFERLYQLTSPRVFGAMLALLKRRDWAEEVVQEAYVRAWRNAKSYQAERGAAVTWIIAIARNAALDRMRKHRREILTDDLPTGEAPPEPVGNAIDDALRHDRAKTIITCLDKLDDGPRRAIILAYLYGYSHEELANTLDVPLGTAKSWIRRGLARLGKCLER